MAIIDDNQGAAGKVCTRCNTWKPLAAFKRRSLRGRPGGDGYITQCRDCQNADRRARRAADPERYREQARTYMMRRRDQSNEYQRAWRLANSTRSLPRSVNTVLLIEPRLTLRLVPAEQQILSITE